MAAHARVDSSHGAGADSWGVAVSPYVSWVHLALAYDPVATPTEGRLRTLRNHHVCPSSVRVPLRTPTGVAGSRQWYSSLGLWAAILFRSGDPEQAVKLAKRANALRSRLSRVDWVHASSSHPAPDLVDLALETDSIARVATSPLRLAITVGTWVWIRGEAAVIELADGGAITLPHDSPHLVQSRVGDPIVVVHQEAPNGTRIRLVLPGLRVSGTTSVPRWTDDLALTPDEGGLHGGIPDTPENRVFFERLTAKATSTR